MQQRILIPRLSHDLVFPNPRFCMDEGLLAYGGDLSAARLIKAYREGIFPWYSEGDPILWWSPNPRLLLYPARFKISKSLRKTIRKGDFVLKIDTRFRDVMERCAKIPRKGENGTWILDEVVDAYVTLHEEGYAHSFETYCEDELVGGLYGISLGRSFFGESMFASQTDASKFALSGLVDFCLQHDFDFIDCQITTEHLLKLGAEEVERDDFLNQLQSSVNKSGLVGSWSKL